MYNLVIIVPAELLASTDILGGEEGHPGEPQVVRVYEHVLHEHIRLTAKIQNYD
jgi:hypothetical protein